MKQLPDNDISDENKLIVNIFCEFLKVLSLIATEVPEVFYEDNGCSNVNADEMFNLLIRLISSTKYSSSSFINQPTKLTIKFFSQMTSFFSKNKASFLGYNNNKKIKNKEKIKIKVKAKLKDRDKLLHLWLK